MKLDNCSIDDLARMYESAMRRIADNRDYLTLSITSEERLNCENALRSDAQFAKDIEAQLILGTERIMSINNLYGTKKRQDYF